MKLNEAVVCKSENVTYRELEGEGVLYNKTNKNIHVLNKTALAVWNLCDVAEDPQDIAKTIAGQYRLPAETVVKDVLDCLARFEELGLIRRISF